MKISGKIVKKRTYIDNEDRNINCITFLELDKGITVNGDRIKIIPLLSEETMVPQNVGDNIEVDGEIIFKKIFTMFGNLSSSPIPTLMNRVNRDRLG
ncbi:hypothetical protein [Effusibacillus consociatus]|uniref:Uncharacterized protein n=1 Tax=Effusibacillus consociatus TaxID=1117041 RepID=A0ABV9Q7E6_9BACL